MPRIRSIKPEFWTDAKIARDLTFFERLFYIALWNEADDEGRLHADPRRLKGALFPYDEQAHVHLIEASLRALAACGRAVLYTNGGETYAFLPKFQQHQKPNRPSKSKLPGPKDLGSAVVETHGALTEPSVSPQGPLHAVVVDVDGVGGTDLPLTSFAPDPSGAASRRALASAGTDGGAVTQAPAPAKGEPPSPFDDMPATWLGQVMPLLRECGFNADDTDGSIAKALEGRISFGDMEAAVRGLARLRDEGGLRPSLGIVPGEKLNLRLLYAQQKGEIRRRPLWNEATERQHRFEAEAARNTKPQTLFRVGEVLNGR